MQEPQVDTREEGKTTMAKCPVNHGFDPLGEQFLADPYPEWARVREATPVFYSSVLDRWVVTRYEDVQRVLLDPDTFSAAEAQRPLYPPSEEAQAILKDLNDLVPVLSNADPPEHARYRKALSRALSPRRIAKLEPTIHDRVSELTDAFADEGQADIVERLFYPLPALTMFILIGFPSEDADRIKHWCEDKLLVNWGRPSEETQIRSAHSMVAYWRYCKDFVRSRREEPRDDLTSELIVNDETLSDPEIASIIFALSFAGHETTTSLLGNTLHQLLRRPEVWNEVCADRSLIPGAVEETLRYDPSVPAWRRVSTRATSIGGVEIPAGARIVLGLGAANHDPERFPDPECFDVRRANAKHQIAFGKGIHLCLGAPLARLEGRIVINMIADRLRNLRLVEDQTLSFSPNISFRGPQKLLVEWEPATVRSVQAQRV